MRTDDRVGVTDDGVDEWLEPAGRTDHRRVEEHQQVAGGHRQRRRARLRRRQTHLQHGARTGAFVQQLFNTPVNTLGFHICRP